MEMNYWILAFSLKIEVQDPARIIKTVNHIGEEKILQTLQNSQSSVNVIYDLCAYPTDTK